MEYLAKLIVIDTNVDTPVYLQITNAFIQHIRTGRIRKGGQLPASRALATLLGVNRMTVVASYDELQAQGWIEMVARTGTFVRQELPEIEPKLLNEPDAHVEFSEVAAFEFNRRQVHGIRISNFPDTNKLIINDGFPDVRLAPIEYLLRSMRSLSHQGAYKKYFAYGSAKGADILCETLADFLGETRGLPISTNNIMVTRGAQMGIYIAANLLLQRGDHVIVGEPNYFGANLTFQQVGATINRVTVDDEGINVDAIEQLCKQKRIRAVYVIPHHHHPTTVTLTSERRLKLLKLAERYRFAVIEDDYDYDFHYARNPVMPIASLDYQGSVIYIGTLAKVFAPAVRIGFMVGPVDFITAAAKIRRVMDWQGDSLMEAAIADLYRDGTIVRHIKKALKIYRARRDHFCDLLKNELGNVVDFTVPEGGMSVWTKFVGMDLGEISRKAYDKGLVIGDGTVYNTGEVYYNAARLGFSSLDFSEQEQAIGILKSVIYDSNFPKFS